MRKKEAAVIVLDTGNILFKYDWLSQKARKMAAEEADLIVDALDHMATDAINIGAYDLAAGVDYLKEKEHSVSFPFLCANLKSLNTKNPIFKPYTIKTINNHLKVGIFGLIDRQNKYIKEKGIYVEDPFVAAKNAVKELKEKGCSLIILLSQMQQRTNKKVADQVSGIHFILGSSSNVSYRSPLKVKETYIIYTDSRGKAVGNIAITLFSDNRSFFNLRERDDILNKITQLKKKNPDNYVNTEDKNLQLALLEERLTHYSGRCFYEYKKVGLDRKIGEDLYILTKIQLLKQDRTKKIFMQSHRVYLEKTTNVDIANLNESQRLLALRIMNETECGSCKSVTVATGSNPLCKKLARFIVDSIAEGKTEGQVRRLIQLKKMDEKKNNLDKGFFVQ